jgi:hypothetical protein
MNIDLLRQAGAILFDDFFIDPSSSLFDQLDNLKEDMLQIEIKKRYILDVGWRPSFDPDGAFKILLIKDYDWDHPVYSGEAKSMDALGEQIKLAMRNAD